MCTHAHLSREQQLVSFSGFVLITQDDGNLGGLRLGLGRGLEAVVESSGDVLQVGHSAGTGGSSSLSLHGPVVGSHLGRWVSARSTGLLLSVERTTATSLAQNVRLSVSLTHRRSTL